ncbi:hypothetical protein DVH24_022231 [Malus domestica]|uniref:Endonuclease/exonuclease/phosphatase domain-containing protein n=1 Tax=Malus domestica TaxID=3750 RepID=A0A498IU84_MALDO|nr:hypothetical protein DVH24_022231 [Malus domestica]
MNHGGRTTGGRSDDVGGVEMQEDGVDSVEDAGVDGVGDARVDGVQKLKGWACSNVAPIETAGRLSIWWDDSIDVEGVDSSKHFIDAQCCVKDSQFVFRFTGVYGTSYRAAKVAFWRGMIIDFYPSTIPWICGGDFNEYMWDWEKAGGTEARFNRHRYLDDFMRETTYQHTPHAHYCKNYYIIDINLFPGWALDYPSLHVAPPLIQCSIFYILISLSTKAIEIYLKNSTRYMIDIVVK